MSCITSVRVFILPAVYPLLAPETLEHPGKPGVLSGLKLLGVSVSKYSVPYNVWCCHKDLHATWSVLPSGLAAVQQLASYLDFLPAGTENSSRRDVNGVLD